MKTNKDVVYTGLGGFFSIILIQFLMSYLTTGNVWEWYEISNNVIPFLVFFIIVLIIIKDENFNCKLATTSKLIEIVA
ncbi:Uncharacterised protein [Macrococcoides caseolyticum]|nr:Uncharacterised protein [Macrococcus caseolyticus]